MAPLDSAWTKLEWAQRHLDLLYGDIRAFYGNDHKTSAGQDDSDASAEHPYTPFRPPPVVAWSLVVGDAVHNMRCTLEHLAYSLATQNLRRLNLARSPARDTGFPLFQSPNTGNFKRLTADIEPDARQIIETLQPYDRRNPLWIVGELDNTDKHERLNIFPAMLSFSGVLTVSGDQPVHIDLANGGIVAIDPTTGKPHKTFDPSFTPSISLKMVMPRTPVELDASILQEVHDFISRNVLPQFARFFATPSQPPPVT